MIKVFFDSDVIISSLISQTGVAHLLINSDLGIEKIVSNLSVEELTRVVKRLGLREVSLKLMQLIRMILILWLGHIILKPDF